MLDRLGVTSLTIKLPFRLNHVNCFIAEGEDGKTVIDSGLNDSEAYKTWKPFIEKKEIRNIFITHYHPDHYGFAGRLQQLTHANVSMTKTEYDTALEFANEYREDILVKNYLCCGIPNIDVEQMTKNEDRFNHLVSPHPEVNRHLNSGDTFQFGKYEYEILDAPGHSDGLICFYNKEANVLFSTDHILPKITPNISYHFYGEANPLELYIQSLNKYKKLEVEFVIPSHGKPFTNASKRIDEILKHHDERFNNILDFIKTPANVYDVCLQLFGSNLNSHEMRFAIGETISHLEYLFHKGECSKDCDQEIYLYQL